MRNFYLIVSFVMASGMISAQNRFTNTADKLFYRYEYVDAAKEYLKLVENAKADNYVYKQLAESYYSVFNSKEAVKWFAKAVEENPDSQIRYKYAQMLKAEGNFAESDNQMQQFVQLEPGDQRAKIFVNNRNYLSDLKKQEVLYEIAKSELSSDKTDFGALLTNNNTVYFATSRNLVGSTNGRNEEPFLDIYSATYTAEGTFTDVAPLESINTKWHDGPVTLTSDGVTMFYGSESFNEKEFTKDKDKNAKFGRMYLFKATNENGKWVNSKPLPFNNKSYDARNPSISQDGTTLYFSSNMPGGFGGEDIWKVTVNADQYGEPENLGEKVNTASNESFPFIADDNVLFFSSNGKTGFGGLDIFKIDLNQEAEAINVGEPVNTSKDDFAFTYNSSRKVGFFASNRDGIDNIYSAKPICKQEAIVRVKNAITGTLLENSKITLLDVKNKNSQIQSTNTKGEALFLSKCDENYMVQIVREGYENGTFSISKSTDNLVIAEVALQPILPIITETEVLLAPIYFEFDKSNMTAQGAAELDKLITVLNVYPDMVIFAKSHTDSKGSKAYNSNLSDRRAKSTVQYLISKGIAKDRISGQGFGESQPKVVCNSCTEEQDALNRRSEFLIIKK
jgi:outer membrane protein OmpA-like peptidoglycan-associated protein/tetratricopeptide (TPR) repeat protein